VSWQTSSVCSSARDRARARRWPSSASRESARPRCSTTPRDGRAGCSCYEPAASSQRRRFRSRRCSNCCARRSGCSTASRSRRPSRSRARSRSGRPGPRNGLPSARRRSVCSPLTPSRARSLCWSTTPTGSTAPAPRRCGSRSEGWWRTRSRCWSRSARTSPRCSTARTCRPSGSAGSAARRPRRCSTRSRRTPPPGCTTPPPATRSGCWSWAATPTSSHSPPGEPRSSSRRGSRANSCAGWATSTRPGGGRLKQPGRRALRAVGRRAHRARVGGTGVG